MAEYPVRKESIIEYAPEASASEKVRTALRETDFYQMVFEANGTAMAILEEDATILLVNARFEKYQDMREGSSKTKKNGRICSPKALHTWPQAMM